MCSELRAALLLAAVLAAGTAPAAAQDATSAPIVVKVKKPRQRLLQYRGEVIRADRRQIVVRDPGDPRFIRTFSYSPQVKEAMEKILDSGANFQFGDRVVIRYAQGTSVAESIRGKPAKGF